MKCDIHKIELKKSLYTPTSYICNKCKKLYSEGKSEFDGIYDTKASSNPISSYYYLLNDSNLMGNTLDNGILKIINREDILNTLDLRKGIDFTKFSAVILTIPISYELYDINTYKGYFINRKAEIVGENLVKLKKELRELRLNQLDGVYNCILFKDKLRLEIKIGVEVYYVDIFP